MGNTTFIAPANEQTLMQNDLNALANNTTNVGETVIDNTTNRYLYAIFELYLDTIDLSAQTNPAVELYLAPSYDGTNYADTGDDADTVDYPPAQYLVAVMGFNTADIAAAHRAVSPHIMLDPVKYTIVVINKLGVAFTASNLSTLKVKTYTPTTA